MPATSKAQRRLIATAMHDPGKIRKKNRGVLKMTPQQMHDFAATPEKELPMHAKGYGVGAKK